MTSDTGWKIPLVAVSIPLFALACAGTGPTGESTLRPAGTELAIDVERVIDGDSFRATSAVGELEVRLLGVNSPERDDCYGDEARTTLTELLSSGQVTISPWPAEIDEFGRELAFVWADDRLVNLELVDSGGALARGDGDSAYTAELDAAERRASAEETGLWDPAACGTPTDAEVRIVELMADAPGDDRQNPNGEWVEIRNDGSAAIDLTGWVVRDESTRHRYRFGQLVLDAGETARLHTGCGSDDTSSSPLWLFWCDPDPPVWNNAGDTAFLLDQNGNIADHLRNG